MILLTMLFCHIVNDYYLQGWLASAKQKKYWRELPNYTDMYKHDYIVTLIMHSMSWAFMIMLPIAVVNRFDYECFSSCLCRQCQSKLESNQFGTRPIISYCSNCNDLVGVGGIGMKGK